MNYISPLDAMLQSIPIKKLQICLNWLRCSPDMGYVSVPIAPVTQELEPFQMKVYQDPPEDLEFLMAIRNLTFLINKPIVAKFSDNTTLKMDGQYLGCVSNSLFKSSEFLMTNIARYSTGLKLDTLTAKHKMTSIYGNQTLKLLGEIGWPTRANSRLVALKVSKKANEFLRVNKKNGF